MKNRQLFHVRKRSLLAIAGTVWIIAGFNVVRLGVLSYLEMSDITFLYVLLSVVVMSAFGFMFFKMSMKHTARINGYKQETKPVWYFFDLKSYCIMAFMMGGGIWLRSSGLVPNTFIAVFYTGLGVALAFAGVVFWIMFFRYKDPAVDDD